MALRRYGWKRDSIDHRDLKLALAPRITDNVPPHWTNVSLLPACFDQLSLGSCTGNAWAAAFEQVLHKLGLKIFRPSRLFIYFNERTIEGTVDEDSGAQIRDGIKAIAKWGVCPETVWPYDITKFTKRPTPTAFATALKHLGLQYVRVQQDAIHIKAVISSGHPVVFGFNVFASFESSAMATTGEMSMPTSSEECVGGHAVMIAAYDDNHENSDGSKGAFLVRNSWGPEWGQQGYFWMPYKFFLDPAYVSDIWTLTQVQ